MNNLHYIDREYLRFLSRKRHSISALEFINVNSISKYYFVVSTCLQNYIFTKMSQGVCRDNNRLWRCWRCVSYEPIRFVLVLFKMSLVQKEKMEIGDNGSNWFLSSMLTEVNWYLVSQMLSYN